MQSSYPNILDWLRARLPTIPGVSEVWGPWHLCRIAQKPVPSDKVESFVPPTLIESDNAGAIEPQLEEAVQFFEEILSNPLDRLPTKFNLDSWKRGFDRARTNRAKIQALDKFWDQFDSAAWSIYKIRYVADPNEPQEFHQLSNKVGSFIYKIETLRPRSFGTIGLYGPEQNLQVIGLFAWHGNGVPQEMYDKEAFAQFNKQKLDPEVAKPLTYEYWSHVEDENLIEGLEPRDVKLWR